MDVVPETICKGKDELIPERIEGELSAKIISCVKMEKTKTTKEKEIFAVRIDKYEKVKKSGIFNSGEYSVFCVSVVGQKHNAWRRFRDFKWLRNSLNTMYPGEFIAPIPKKSAFNKANEEEEMELRMKMLNLFMDELFLSEVLRKSKILSDFLEVTDQRTF